MTTFAVQVDTGPLAKLLDEDAEQLVGAVRTVLLRSGSTVKNALRRMITGAGLGKLAFAIQREVTAPRGALVDVQVRVKSKAIVKRPGGLFDLTVIFGEGAVVRPVRRTFLAIPFPNIGQGPRGRKLTPSDFPKGSLVFVPLREGRIALLISKADDRPMFLLVRQAVIGKRLNLEDATKTLSDITDKIVREWDRRRARITGSSAA